MLSLNSVYVMCFCAAENLMMLLCALKLWVNRHMPLTKRVTFKTKLQRGNRIQIPRLLLWEFKMEPIQVLRVRVHFEESWNPQEKFYAHMSKDGRITIPKLTCNLLKTRYKEQDVVGAVFEVDLAPSDDLLEEDE